MPQFARPETCSAAKQGVSPAAAAPPQLRSARPQRGAMWHLLQLKAAQAAAQASAARAPGRSGLPASLKAGVETLSGIAMDDVRVHRNSPEPARLGALAYTQGSDIHLGPGQERHLPHEAWHVVQQKQGRVHATAQYKGVALNEDGALEREADARGAEALRVGGGAAVPSTAGVAAPATRALTATPGGGAAVQRRLSILNKDNTKEVLFSAYSDELERQVKGTVRESGHVLAKMKEWFADNVDRTYMGVADCVRTIEGLSQGPKLALEHARKAEIKSDNKGNKDEITSNKISILRSEKFQNSFKTAMKVHVDKIFIWSETDYVKATKLDRILSFASECLKAGNCGEISEIVFWKMMEVGTGCWIGRVRLYPEKNDKPLDKSGQFFDHVFNIIHYKEFKTGHKPDISKDAIVVDAWWDPDKATTLGEYYDRGNHYKKTLTADNLYVMKVEKSDGLPSIHQMILGKVRGEIDKLINESLKKK